MIEELVGYLIIRIIMMINDEKKNEVWKHFVSLPKSYRPNGLTDKRLEKVKYIIWKTEFFWDDVVCRHGLLDVSIVDLKLLDKETYEHCMGNFWGMMMEIMHKSGII
jgi:hypothetical protein